MSIIGIFVIWTWGLTPVWVNVVTTVILGLRISIKMASAVAKTIKEMED